mmetsp:Transcript_111942/g.316958  ORF Transcript_111942/g.316958 Transcript_111942/m.316958 type:complete len:251 (-) Transcript_111942:132-884(-)
MFFIMFDICSLRFGSDAICWATFCIMSASSGLRALRSVILAACCWRSGAAPPQRISSIFLRSSSGMDLKLSMAAFIMSGFFWRCSIWAFIVAASMPGGRGVLPIILWRSSADMPDMTSVACFSMSGSSASSAAFCHLSLPKVGALLLLLLALAPPPVAGDCHAAETSCCGCAGAGASSSLRPASLTRARSRCSSAAMALSDGEISDACRTSAKASSRPPSSDRAWPLRKSALKFLGSSFSTSSDALRASL